MKKSKRVFSLLLCFVMLLSLFPTAVFAETENATEQQIPSEQEAVVEPEAPAESETPNETETPDVPETPEETETSNESVKSEAPGSPEALDVSETSGEPETPNESEGDTAADEPGTPNKPETPDKPETLDESETPNEEVETEEDAAEEPDEPSVEPVRVVFDCDPPETVVTVYDPAQLDENGEPTVIEPEEDGSWLLVPGTYLYDAQCEGYEAAEKVEFEVSSLLEGEERLLVEVLLINEKRTEPESLRAPVTIRSRGVNYDSYTYSLINSNNITGQQIVDEARSWPSRGIGNAYYDSPEWGNGEGVALRSGYNSFVGVSGMSFDCSGFVSRVLNDVGLRGNVDNSGYCVYSVMYGEGQYISSDLCVMLRYGDSLNSVLDKVNAGDYSDLHPGDIMGWCCLHDGGGPSYNNHIVIYAGDGKMIEFTPNGYLDRPISGSGYYFTRAARLVPWIKVSAEYPCDLTVTLTKNPDTNVVEVWSMPGSNSTYPESTTIDTLSSGTKVHATQIIQNAVTSSAHYWYKISYGSGKTGYIFTNYTKNPTQNWTVSASDVTKPGNLSIGDSFTMRGTVSTGGSKITKLQGFIYPGETTAGTAAQSSDAINPNSTQASISSIDSSLYFNNINSTGTYTYTVKVDLSSYTMANGTPKEEKKNSIVVDDVTTNYTVGNSSPKKGGSGEYAIFPAYTMYVSCIAYEQENGNGTGAQHGSQNAIDILPYGNVFAPFTGRIAYVDANWGYVTLQSLEKVYWADGSYDYMTVGFMHDSDISDLYVGKVISQGTNFYQAGGMGEGNPDAYGAHVHITVHRGTVTRGYPYGTGDEFAFNAFYMDESKTSIVRQGSAESGNLVYQNAPRDYNGLWRTLGSSGSAMTSGAGQTIPDGDYIIASYDNPLYYLDISGSDYPAATASNVNLWGERGDVFGAYDAWTVKYIGDGGFYSIMQNGTDISLDVANASCAEGANIQVCVANGSDAQKWSISPNSDGSYRIQAKCSGMSVEVYGGDITAGTNIDQWSSHDGVNQKWTFIPYQDMSYLNQCVFYQSYQTGEITASTRLKFLPCPSETDANSTDVVSSALPVGTRFLVTGMYRNTSGDYWYRVKLTSGANAGKEGYLPCANVTTTLKEDGISYSGKNFPTGLTVGNFYAVEWTITSDYLNLSTIDGYIYNGSNYDSTRFHGQIEGVNSTSRNLDYSAIDDALLFNQLSIGNYKMEITATAINNYCTDGRTLQSKTIHATPISFPFMVVSSGTSSYVLDLNGFLDGSSVWDIGGYGRVDIYINGCLVDKDSVDYYTSWPSGARYELKNIRALSGYVYNGVNSGALSGTINGDTTVVLSFSTAVYAGNKINFHAQGGFLGQALLSRTFDGINAARGVGQLIVYNAPLQYSDCNSYGNEVAVDSTGRVIAVRRYGDENQLSIPNGGFVLSGHLTYPDDANDGGHFLANVSVGQYIGLNYANNSASIFDSQTAYLANSKYVSSGTTYGTLPEPTRDNYVFDGWYTAAEGGTKIVSSSTYSTSDLYAHWKNRYYTVSYNANGGTGQPANQTKEYGVALTLSNTKPTRADASSGSYTVTLNANGGTVGASSLTAVRTTKYSFKSWNTAQNGSGTSYNPGASYTTDANVTLYAQWNSSTSTAAVTLPTPTREGYDFKGWSTSNNVTSGTTGSYTPTGNVTLYATWTLKKYTVTYNANGGTGQPDNQIKTHGTALTLSNTKPSKASTSAGNYTVTLNANGGSVSTTSLTANRTTSYSFKNWNTVQNGSGTSYAPGASYTANADVTLYAQWNSNTTTAAVTLPTPTREGYDFKGWSTSNTATGGTTGNYTPTGNVTLYATWTLKKYTVTYNANGGTGQPGNQEKTHGTALTLSSTKPTKASTSAGSYTVTLNPNNGSVNPTSLTAARTTNYSFKNWNTAQNGSGTSYNPGASYTTDANVTLYAQWNSSTTTAVVTLPTPTRTGYSFMGWATSNTATSGSTGNYTPTGNVTLYAIWAINKYTISYNGNGGDCSIPNQIKTHGTALTLSTTQPTRANTSAGSYTVTLNANGGSVSPTSLTAVRTTSYSFKNWNTAQNGSGTSYNPGASYTTDANVTLYAQWNSSTSTAAVTLPTATCEGYTFNGWATSSTATSGVTGSYIPTENVTLYATWKADIYTVTYDANGGTDAPSNQVKTYGDMLILSDTMPTRASISAGSCTVTLNPNGGSVNPSSLTAKRTTSYSFRDWNTKQDGSGASYNPGRGYFENASVTLYAQWNSTTSTASVILPTPTRTGYTFLGWADRLDAVTSTTGFYTPCGDVTLYALWKEDTFLVNYDANGGTATPKEQLKYYSKDLILTDSVPAHGDTYSSYTVTLDTNYEDGITHNLTATRTTSYSFRNWNAAQDESGTSYAPGASYTTNAAVTLYAQWNSSTKTAAIMLPNATREGYTFQGWATSSTATSGVTGSYTPTGNVTLYATWKKNAPTVWGTISIDSVNAQPGKEISVPVRLENNPGLIAVEFSVSYDSSILEWIGVEPGEYAELGDYDLSIGQPLAWFASDERTDITLNGVFATLTFRVNANAEDGETTVTASYDEDNLFNAEMENVAFAVKPGTVTIKSHIPGDVNGDGKVNNKDYMALRRYIKYKDNVVVEAALDINADGKVNNKDYMTLRRYIKFHDVEIH